MRPQISYCSIAAVGIAMLFTTSATAQQVTVSGVTYKIDDNTGKYIPLGNVMIQAYRNMAPVLNAPAVSDPKDGSFSFVVPAGDPFEVCFHGAKRMPTLKMLAGVAMVKNEVHVVLLTKDQYEKKAMAKQVPAEKKVECVLMQLPKDDEFVRKMRLDWSER